MPENRYSEHAQPSRGSRAAGYTQGQSRPAARPPQGARPAAPGAARPAARPPQGARPAASGAARPAARPPQGARPAVSGAARPAARPPQGARPAAPGAARPAARPPQGARPAARPAARPPQGARPAAKNGGYGELPPIIRTVCGIMSVLLLMMVCVGITKTIRDGIPRPTISTQVQQDDAAVGNQNTEQPARSEQPQQTNQPLNNGFAAPSATDEPAVNTPPVGSGSGRRATIRAIGDVIIDEEMLENGEVSKGVYDFSPMFSLAKGVMSDADWTLINIDATLRKGRYGYSGYPQFSTPPSILNVLTDCGVDMLTMCNNHALDGYFDGLKESLDLADAAGLAHVGAYRSQKEFDTPEIYTINGIRVGMLNYTQYTNGMASLSDKNATIYGMRLMDGADYAEDIADLRAGGAEFVIVIMHWGKEYVRYPEADTEAVARRLVAAGADLIIGGHPHVVQPAEYITATDANGRSRTALCIYSIGNFLSEHRHENAAYTDNGVIFEFTLQENDQGAIELVDPNCIPVYMWQIDLGGGKHDYRIVPTGEYLSNPPAGMSDAQYQRMCTSWDEINSLFAGMLPVNAN